jgi:hypothetical protein
MLNRKLSPVEEILGRGEQASGERTSEAEKIIQ